MGLLSTLFAYLPLLLALYSAWSSGGYTPLLQFALTIVVGRLLNNALGFLLQLAFAGAKLTVLVQVALIPGAIAAAGYWCGCSMQMLASYGFTSFLFPGIRRAAPRTGPPAIAAAIASAVAYAWATEGISPLFVFVIFIQALPEIQRSLWIGGKTRWRLHGALIAVVVVAFCPFALLGAVAVVKPELLASLSEAQLQMLCRTSNGCPSTDHRDLYAALGLRRYATMSEVRKAYRRMSLENHPDKLTDQAISTEEREARVDAFTKAAAAYEVLSKPGAQGQYDAMMKAGGVRPELLDLVPRCVACGLMLCYWLLLTCVNLREAQRQRHVAQERFRQHVLRRGPLNLPAIGLKSREPLEDYARFHELPVVTRNDPEELERLRDLLRGAGVTLDDPAPGVERTIVRSTRGDPEALRAHILNGGAMCMDNVGVDREALESYAKVQDNELPAVKNNDKEDVLKMREMLEKAGLELQPLPDEDRLMLVDVAVPQ